MKHTNEKSTQIDKAHKCVVFRSDKKEKGRDNRVRGDNLKKGSGTDGGVVRRCIRVRKPSRRFHSQHSASRKSPDFLVLEGRLDLLPRGRGGGVRGLAVPRTVGDVGGLDSVGGVRRSGDPCFGKCGR